MTKRKSKFLNMTAEEFRRGGPERDIRASVCHLLALCKIPFSVTDGALIFDDKKKVAGRAVTTTGWPDISATLPPAGRSLYVETKAARGRLEPEQIACHLQLRAAGALVIVPRSLEDAAEGLLDAGIESEVLRKIVRR